MKAEKAPTEADALCPCCGLFRDTAYIGLQTIG